MQDIDFSRYYRRQRQPYSQTTGVESKATPFPVGKVPLYLAIAFSSLAIGFIGGTQLQKSKMTREIENRVVPESVALATVAAPTAGAEPQEGTVHTTRPAERPAVEARDNTNGGKYLILAKIFPDEKEASLAGLTLKRAGQKAFMARNGRKVKLYVGPIEGRTEAYDVLAKLKKNSEFSGAILYKK